MGGGKGVVNAVVRLKRQGVGPECQTLGVWIGAEGSGKSLRISLGNIPMEEPGQGLWFLSESVLRSGTCEWRDQTYGFLFEELTAPPGAHSWECTRVWGMTGRKCRDEVSQDGEGSSSDTVPGEETCDQCWTGKMGEVKERTRHERQGLWVWSDLETEIEGHLKGK